MKKDACTLIDELQKENKKLKKTVSALQKQLQTYNVVETEPKIQEYLDLKREEKIKQYQDIRLKEKWQCNDCGRGLLRIKKYSVVGKLTKYYRECDNCGKRTKSKDFVPEKVEGIVAQG